MGRNKLVRATIYAGFAVFLALVIIPDMTTASLYSLLAIPVAASLVTALQMIVRGAMASGMCLLAAIVLIAAVTIWRLN